MSVAIVVFIAVYLYWARTHPDEETFTVACRALAAAGFAYGVMAAL